MSTNAPEIGSFEMPLFCGEAATEPAKRNLLSWIVAGPTWLVLTEALVLVGLAAWFDYVTGWQWSVSELYVPPLVLVSWKTNWRLGLGFAFLCALSWYAAQIESNPHHFEWWVANAAVVRFLSFGLVVAATSAIKSQRKIDRARIATAERAQQLERQLLQIADREKDRLGRELHDGLCQNLAGIAALSSTLSRQLSPHHQPAAEAAAEINRLLCGTITEARNLAHGLNPVELNGSGLIAALKTLAHNTEILFRVSCTFRCNRSSSALGAEVERHLYRIIQEAVRNAVSHGQPSDISISLRFATSRGVLIVHDNGPGFSVSAPEGHGLKTMKYRAALIGAPLSVRTDRRRGTRVDCVFDLPMSPIKTGQHG